MKTHHCSLFNICAGSMMLLIAAQQLSAAEKIWNGGGADNSWLTAGNWTGGVPADSTATDTATFGVSSRYSIHLGTAARSINGMTFNSNTSYNLNLYDSDLTTSRVLTVGAGGITVSNGNHTITGAKPGSGTAGSLRLGTGTFDVASGSILTFDSRLSANGTSSAYTKSGAGTLVLNADNGGGFGWNFTSGLFTVSAGILELAASGNSGNSANKWSVSSGATLKLSASGALQVGTAGLLTLNGNGVSGVGALHASNTTAIGGSTGTIDLASNSRIGVDAAQTLTIARTITGTGGLEKTGSGSLRLDGTNTFSGATTVMAGTLQGIGSINSTLAIQGGATLAPGNSIESLGTGALSFQANSTYAYELQTDSYGATPAASADLTYSSGTLDIAAGTILTLTDLATSTTLASGSKLTLISYFGGWTSGELFSYDGGSGLVTLADDSIITLGANQWLFNYNDTSGGLNYATDQIGATNFVTMTVIPEPRAALLVSLGLLILLRRRRQA